MGETCGEQASPHAVVLVRGSDYARSLTFTRRGLEILAERKPGHDFQCGEAEARRILHDDQRSTAGRSRGRGRRPVVVTEPAVVKFMSGATPMPLTNPLPFEK